MEPILQESIISVTNVHKSIQPQLPPWIIKNPLVILQLNKLHETITCSTYEVHTISFQTFFMGTFIDSTHMKY